MARPALIESLRRQAALDAAAIRESARAEAERHREALAAALEQERAHLEATAAAEARRLVDEGAAEANRRARELHAAAALALGDRLFRLAQAELPRLRGEATAELFDALARELPPRRWQRVRVNPADATSAARHFPGADIVRDPALSGGMELECEDGRIAISNTLETRLANVWPDVLPGLLAALSKDRCDRGPAA